MSQYSEAINKVYGERKDFIIIGLTGRTGAGCTTVANLLTKSFNELKIKAINSINSNNDRKNRMIYNYAAKNWESFVKIEVRNIITSFILEKGYQDFLSYINTSIEAEQKKYIIGKLEEDKELCNKFNELNKLRIDIKNRVENDKTKGNYEKSLGDEDIYQFYFIQLPQFTSFIKNKLREINKDLYFNIYQAIGRNIRKSGSAYENKFKPDKIYIMPQRINKMIKILRRRNLKEMTGVRVVIDSLKNPYEISFFKDRYSSFYTFAIHNDENVRRKILQDKMELTVTQIKRIDDNEYCEKIPDDEKFYAQSIQSCYQVADVHLTNDYEEGTDLLLQKIKLELIKYITLIMHPGIITPSNIERCMNFAYSASLNSGCLSRGVGAVITNEDFSILSSGWNSVPTGQVSCNLRNVNDLINKDNINDFSHFELNNKDFRDKVINIFQNNIKDSNLKGRQFSFCFKDFYDKKNQVHTRSLHAEENAFLQLIKNGVNKLDNGKLFTTASPCVLCSKKAYQLGIKEIYYIDQYPDISEEHILNQGSFKPELIKFNGAIGRAYFQLYNPIMPMKDELYLLAEIKSKDFNKE